MSKPAEYRRTYIREWRHKRGLSLRQLAERLEESPGGELLISHTSIGRMLLEVNPEKDGDVVDITLRLNKAPPELRKQAIDIVHALLQSAGSSR